MLFRLITSQQYCFDQKFLVLTDSVEVSQELIL